MGFRTECFHRGREQFRSGGEMSHHQHGLLMSIFTVDILKKVGNSFIASFWAKQLVISHSPRQGELFILAIPTLKQASLISVVEKHRWHCHWNEGYVIYLNFTSCPRKKLESLGVFLWVCLLVCLGYFHLFWEVCLR